MYGMYGMYGMYVICIMYVIEIMEIMEIMEIFVNLQIVHCRLRVKECRLHTAHYTVVHYITLEMGRGKDKDRYVENELT